MSNFPPYTTPVAFDARAVGGIGGGAGGADGRDSRSEGPGPDPGSRGAGRIAWVLCAVLLAVIVAVQQLGPSALSGSGGTPSAPVSIEPPSMDPTDIQARLYVKLASAMPSPALDVQFADALFTQAREADTISRVRAFILLAATEKPGGLSGNSAAETAIADVRRELLDADGDPASNTDLRQSAIREVLSKDLDAALAALQRGPAALTPEQRDALIAHHGWIGRMLVTRDEPDTHPDKVAIARGGPGLLIGMVAIGGVAILALLTGLILLALASIARFGGKLKSHFAAPLPGGSMGVEVLAVFMAGFVMLKVVTASLAMAMPGLDIAPVAMVLQWALLLVVFYPLLRGVPWSRTRAMLGLTLRRADGTRSSLAREIAAGVIGYLAVVPLFVLGAVASVVLMLAWTFVRSMLLGSPPAPANNPIIDIVAGAGGWQLIAFALLATVWAPLLEEIIFRGGLYRHLRSRLHWIFAGAGSALVFGLMHGYALLMLGPVIMLGLGFAMLREWRGSLVACIVAHFIHNSTVIALMIVMLRFLQMP
jgi:membrane protease YdiL (CAAX protease family)